MARLTPARAPLAWVVIGAVLAAGCGGDGSTGPTGTVAAELVKDGGDAQAWFFDNPLPAPYTVQARDAAGLPVPGVTVTWTVVAGNGAVDPPVVVTGSDGRASATHTLGVSGSSQRVRASAPGLPDLDFESTGALPPTSAAISVADNFFSPQHATVQVAGTVTWSWTTPGQPHNIIFANGPVPRPSDSPTQSSGSYASTFTVAGRYEYFCNIHSGMDGSVTVVR